MSTLTLRETREIERANDSGKPPVVFVHGLWLLGQSWERWAQLFEEEGYTAVVPGWPDDPETVAEANARPERFAGKRVEQVRGHLAEVVQGLHRKPLLVGHSFGGLFVQMLAGMGLSAASVAVSPAPFRGVLPLPFSAIRAALPVLKNPANFGRAVALSLAQFRFAFANAVDADEAGELHRTYAVPATGAPIFQAAAANLLPWTELKVDIHHPQRGPLLILSGEKDNTVPRSMAHAAYQRQQHNPGVTEFRELTNRGHSLVIDHGWREVAEEALSFLKLHGATELPRAHFPRAAQERASPLSG